MTTPAEPRVAVLIPCYNEGTTIRAVVAEFMKALPQARVYVFDNNSSDDTAREAAAAGAVVVPSPLQGKGHVVRHMFEHVHAEHSIMVDGDGTYPASAAGRLLELAVAAGADMLVGVRLGSPSSRAFRKFHTFGNHLISGLISRMFGVPVTDALSGYRVFSRAFTESVPVTSAGFQIETELTLHAITKKFVFREVPIEYGARPPGSHSKLNTYRDGVLIVSTIVLLFRDYKPLPFFSAIAAVFLLSSLLAGSVPVIEYYQTGLVPHFPRAILAASLALCSLISFSIGIVLDTMVRYHRENFELHRKLLRAVRREEPF